MNKHSRLNIRSALLLLLVAISLALSVFPMPSRNRHNQTPTAPAARLNIISIVTDDQARWSVGAYGNRESYTPNMLGIRIPDGVKQEGMDFSPLLRGQKLAWRDAVFGQYDLHNAGLAYLRMIRTSEWKLIRHHHANQMDELYDLKRDPDETKNLYDQPAQAAIRDQLQQRLTAWQRTINDPLLRDHRKQAQARLVQRKR